MLDLLRKNASSWGIKALLILICIVFIFFFGSASMRGPQLGSATVAKVNGKAISSKQLDGLFRMQMDFNPMFKNLPEQFKPQVRQNALYSFIEEQITGEKANNWGLRVSKDEIKEIVLKNPNLLEDGKFNIQFYQERYRPGFANRYGTDYEDWITRNLLRDKLKKSFDQSIVLSDQTAKEQAIMDSTKIKVLRVGLIPSRIAGKVKITDEELS